jgi:hypothetical protein
MLAVLRDNYFMVGTILPSHISYTECGRPGTEGWNQNKCHSKVSVKTFNVKDDATLRVDFIP